MEGLQSLIVLVFQSPQEPWSNTRISDSSGSPRVVSVQSMVISYLPDISICRVDGVRADLANIVCTMGNHSYALATSQVAIEGSFVELER